MRLTKTIGTGDGDGGIEGVRERKETPSRASVYWRSGRRRRLRRAGLQRVDTLPPAVTTEGWKRFAESR